MITLATIAGILLVVLAFASTESGFLISGCILLSAAMIAVQMARLKEPATKIKAD